MRPETSEALARLVSIYVTLIERAGYDISDANVAKIKSDPFAACETLNELAVKFGALSPEADSVIAAIYESMDATDARSAADEACLAMAASAWETSHVERPVPEPEPEPVAEAAPEDSASDQPEGDDEGERAEKPKRRRTRKSKKTEAADAQAAEQAEGGTNNAERGAETAPQGAEPQEDAPVDVKPGRRSRAKAKAKKAEKPADSPAMEPADGKPASTEAPKEAAPTQAQAPATASDDLTVDQAVAILGVSRPTVYKLIESGELPAYKKGRSWRISAEAVSKRAAR